MPRSGWVKPQSGQRLSDSVSVGLLTRVFPPGLVDEVIAEAGAAERRRRALPARTVAYYAIGLALFADESYEDVMGRLTEGLSWASGWEQAPVMPSKSAIFQARARLGADPLERLFRRVARPLVEIGAGDASGVGSAGLVAGLRAVALDGACLDVPDTGENDAHFGRAGTAHGRAAFPQARLVALAECATHAIVDAEAGPYTTSELALAGPVLDRLQEDMLMIADRGFVSVTAWHRAAATGAALLWRLPIGGRSLNPEHLRTLDDGSWLGRIVPVWPTSKTVTEPFTVRIIDYTIDDGRDNGEDYRLMTTLLDPQAAPADDLALAYAHRWQIETTFDELKTHQRGPRMVLRSKSPDLVYQEIWGHLCCHYAIRTLMADVAAASGHEPGRVSFTAALRITRRSLAHQGDFPPSRA